MDHAYKVLQITAADITVKKLLLPLIDRLVAEGYDVHIACSLGDYVAGLRADGYRVHTINIKRCISPFSNLKSLWHLYCLIKKEQFDIIHVHTPIAATLGRIAAWAARVPVIIYTAHGFYFHERMSRWVKRPIIWVEKFLGSFTHLLLTQSQEDAVIAIKENICGKDSVVWIGNGVDLGRFAAGSNGFRAKLGLTANDKVIGFVGRLIAEKGILDLVTAMKHVVRELPDAKLIIIGDTLDNDRDKNTKRVIRDLLLNSDGLASNIIFTGFIEDIPAVMNAIDIFVLPSYREGMPRSIIEAMASKKPVVATDIRGCREEVIPRSTGLLVPVGDCTALAEAITTLLSNRDLALQMGNKGKQRAIEMFNEGKVLDKQIRAYTEVIRKRLPVKKSFAGIQQCNPIQILSKRALDIFVSLLSLIVLSPPFMLFSVLIKLDSRGPVFFRQERIGQNNKTFHIWKFRTMIDGAVNHGLGLNVARDDSRFTRIGKLLRNWGLDELPQLINVLSGKMSLVGPRPTLSHQVEKYDDFERQRLLVKPGITSLAIVNGRNLLSWKERIRLDIWYIKHWSFWLDMKIIVGTFWAILVTRKGIYGAEGVNDDFVPSGTTGQKTKAVSRIVEEEVVGS